MRKIVEMFSQIGSSHPTLGETFGTKKTSAKLLILALCRSALLGGFMAQDVFETEQHIAQGSHNLCNQDQGIAHQNYSNYKH